MHRRSFLQLVGASALAGAGCASFGPLRNPSPIAPATQNPPPTAAQLVHYLNSTAERVQSLEVADLALDIKSDGHSAPGVGGTLHCQRPRFFRMRAKSIVGSEADFGSNDNEFWYWIKRDPQPRQYYCAYADLARGGVRLPFPFQPDWMMDALGMATYANVDNFRVEVKGRSVDLIERATDLQGQAVQKVTVFNLDNTSGKTPQVTGYRLEDAGEQLVARATVLSVQPDPTTGVRLPREVRLEWPAQRLELTLTLDGVRTNKPNAMVTNNPALYTRQPIGGAQPFDLARGMPGGGVRPAGANYR